MSIPLVDLKAQYRSIKPEIDEAIRRVVKNASFIMGPEVRAFESAFAGFVRVREAADMDDIMAIAGRHKLWVIEDAAQARAAARICDRLLEGHDVITPAERPYNTHVYHCYAIRSPRRDALVQHLARAEMGVVVHYPLPLHLQPVYRGIGKQRGAFPAAEAAADEVVSLPMFAEITEERQARVAAAIEAFAGEPVPLG